MNMPISALCSDLYTFLQRCCDASSSGFSHFSNRPAKLEDFQRQLFAL